MQLLYHVNCTHSTICNKRKVISGLCEITIIEQQLSLSLIAPHFPYVFFSLAAPLYLFLDLSVCTISRVTLFCHHRRISPYACRLIQESRQFSLLLLGYPCVSAPRQYVHMECVAEYFFN